MTPAITAALAMVVYVLGYRLYARWLATRVFALDANRPTPAHTLRDDVDYVPTQRGVLFAHHYASITGLAPMLGPAVAVIWGWVPAMLWILFGSLAIGCVSDFSALVISMRHEGQSIGDVTARLVGRTAGSLFHAIIFFGVALAMGVFVYVTSRLLAVELAPGVPGYPSAVLPSGLLMLVAVVIGFATHRFGVPMRVAAPIGFAIQLVGVWLGQRYPTMGLDPSSWPSPTTWSLVLLAYAFVACVTPVWALLQSRDFLNALLLYLGLGLAYVGLFVGDHQFVAPAVRLDAPGAPDLFPTVFIVIACGAASGFHALVSSGTTAKQINREPDARAVGYGGMIGESLLGLLATLACTAGLSSESHWHEVYADWSHVQALPQQIGAFIRGTTTFLDAAGLPSPLSQALISMVVVSFALTTLDSATRLLRFNVEEIASGLRVAPLRNRYLSSLVACAAIALFAFYELEGVVNGAVVKRPAGLALWQLFGTTNQLLAVLALGVVTLWLRRTGRPAWPAALPMAFMMVTTFTAMAINLRTMRDPLLLGVGIVLLLLALGVLAFVTRALWGTMRRRGAD